MYLQEFFRSFISYWCIKIALSILGILETAEAYLS